MLTAHHLYVLLDIHQDGWGERANGEPLGSDGFPEWMTITNGATNTHTDFPFYYVTNPAIAAAFQSLWDDVDGPDGVSLQTSVAKMFGALAEHFGRNPRVLGYDSFNEPWPGPNWVPCATPPAGCPDQDHASLDPLYAKVTNAIRASDRRHLVFGEPFVLFNFGVPTAMSLPGDDARSGMSFHLYAATPADEPNVVKSALDWSAATGGALLNTEWGATDDTAAITRQADLLDGALIPWMYWSYDEEIVPDLHRTPGGANLSPQTSAIVRPHPIAVVGTPTAMHYDAVDESVRLLVERAARGRRLLPARHGDVGQHPDADLSERVHGAGAGSAGDLGPVRADADPRGPIRRAGGIRPRHARRCLPARALSSDNSRVKRPFGGHFTVRSCVHRNPLPCWSSTQEASAWTSSSNSSRSRSRTSTAPRTST